jgi:hypothetical protein
VRQLIALLAAMVLLGACAAADGSGDQTVSAQQDMVPVPTAPGPPESETTAPTTPSTLTQEQQAFVDGIARAEEERRQQEAQAQAVRDYLEAVAAEQTAVDDYLEAIAREKAAEQAAINAYLTALAVQRRFLG